MDQAYLPTTPDSVASSAAPRTFTAPLNRRQPLLIRGAALMACLDSLAAVAAILVVLISKNLASMPVDVSGFLSARVTVKNVLLVVFLATTWPLVFNLFGVYDARRGRHFDAEARRVALATTAGAMLALVFPLTSVTGSMTFSSVPYFWLSALALGLLVRVGKRAVENASGQGRRALIVGTGPLARRAYRDLRLDPQHHYEVVGFVDDLTHITTDEMMQAQVIGTLEQLEPILMRQVIDEVIIALPVKSRYQEIQTAIGVCERAGIKAKYGADMFESTVAFPRYDGGTDRAFVAMQVVPDGHRLMIKRAIDIAGASMGLVLLSPVLLLIAAAIKLTGPGPITYKQDRCGLRKRSFWMYKFRSMCVGADQLQAALEDRNEAQGPVFKIRHDPRITPLGRVLRRTSLDELPQLWNVLRGDMSLVGPRPLPWRDVERIDRPSDMRRFSMRPGITCLWQVQGRSNIDFERWVELDVEYIDTWSLWLDARILVRTIPAVLSGDGAT
jgi:exopolysaccharide biosynthesis polyprenyl glycosylphosphotransferase